MSYVTTFPIVIPAGSEVRLATLDGNDCYEINRPDDLACIRIFIGRQAAREVGLIAPTRPTLSEVPKT